MERDAVILVVYALAIFGLNLIVNFSAGISLFPLINPYFCYESINIGLCDALWSFLEISGICALIYFFFLKKKNERIM